MIETKTYDAIIIGAGPAGGCCARELSAFGKDVLLIERERDFSANDFSSGGSTLDCLDTFNLPEALVGAFCNQIKISSSLDHHTWRSEKPLAIVFDFRKLRTFLAEETIRNGSELRMGWSYQGHEEKGDFTLVALKKAGTRTIQHLNTRVLVDATGSERKVLSGGISKQHKAIVGRGVEFLIEVGKTDYQTHASCLAFFIGQKWMPQGYAWIFPMKNGRLKIGVGRNYPNEQVVPYEKPFRFYLDRLISEQISGDKATILDQHGKTISYTSHQRDLYSSKHVIAIGDAISTVNPLTFEGIRHAMLSGRIAAEQVNGLLDQRIKSFRNFKSTMRGVSGFKWIVSEQLTKKIYREADDNKVDLMLIALKCFNLKDLLDLVFHYRPGTALKFYIFYIRALVKSSFRLRIL